MPRDMTATGAQALQRSRGEAFAALKARNGRPVVAGLRQAGSAKAMLPRTGGPCEVVFLNTSGGLAGGDRLSYTLDVGAGLSVTATTQTAERAYRAPEGVAQVSVRHRVGAGSRLDWIPQETILFDNAAVQRETVIELADDAECLSLETVVLGRAAMGETVGRIHLRDTRRILRGGKPLHDERLLLTDDTLTAGAAALGGARAFSTLVLAAPAAQHRLCALRAVLDEPGTDAAASAMDGRLVLRILARDGWPLRRQLARALAHLRRDPLPRVWQI
ncbi:urease accessory protein UreD [Mesobacterium pallidum]|uniref:urease accessory protein UreD n=1 Tax=Mesobacterium pallidum TaxID=2872037 RepID=UPI00300C76B4